LDISKEIVGRHGGELMVESPVPGTESGTRISFRMPVVAPPAVMIVDDDPVHSKEMETSIGEHGYHVVSAACGEDALNLIAISKPDIIVLNLMLSDIDGRDVIMRLKGDLETARIPVLAMSGASLDHAVADVLRNFGIPVISKPCDAIELLDGIANAFLRSIPFVSR
jgi:DNA-binding response OmpR family regulator